MKFLCWFLFLEGKVNLNMLKISFNLKPKMFSILLLIDTKLNLLYCVNNIFIIDESFHLNYFF